MPARLSAASLAALALLGCARELPPPNTPAPHLLLAEAAPDPAPASPPAPTSDSSDVEPGGPKAGLAPLPEHSEVDRVNRDRESREFARSTGWIVLGVGAAAGAIALGTGAYMLTDLSTRNSGCSGKVCTIDGINANSELAGLSPWNAGAFIVAAVGLVGGAFLVLTNPATPTERPGVAATPLPAGISGVQVGVTPAASGGALSLKGAF